MDEQRWYDDPAQIAPKLMDLRGLREVVEVREKARCCEPISDLVFFGHFESNRCGLFAFKEGILPPEVQAQVSPVCTTEEFLRLVQEKGSMPEDGAWHRGTGSSRGSYSIPTPVRRCPRCGKGWDMTNFWDVYEDQDFHDYPLDAFVGKTLAETETIIDDQPEASYCPIGSHDERMSIRPAGVPDYGTLFRREGSMVQSPTFEENEAWRTRLREVGHGYVVQQGDALRVFRYQSYHGACYQELCRGMRERELTDVAADLAAMLEDAGFTDARVTLSLPPQHILEELADEFDEDEGPATSESLGEEMPYFTASTAQGNLGFLIAGEGILAIDLKAAGVKIEEFRLHSADAAPPGCSLIGCDDSALRQLCILMDRKCKRMR